MTIKTGDGRTIEIHPASKDDTPKIVSAIFNVNDKIIYKKRGKKELIKQISGLSRDIKSTELDEGVLINAIEEETKQVEQEKAE